MDRATKDGLIQRLPDPFGFKKHATQAATKEHDGDRHMLHVRGTPAFTRTGKMLQENICDAIHENHAGLREFGSGNVGFPLGNNRA